MFELVKHLRYNGPTVFSRRQLTTESELFLNRAALFFTPTEHIPPQLVGSGRLDVTLPIVSPSDAEYEEIYGYRIPRLWVDLLQRASGKLRWRPMYPAKLTVIRYDVTQIGVHHHISGLKAVIDALKVRTSGRTDGRWLYYFGALADDDRKSIVDHAFPEVTIDHLSEARCRIIVEQVVRQCTTAT